MGNSERISLLPAPHGAGTGIFSIRGCVKRNGLALKHFPIFIALEGRRVVLSGGGDAALAKLRLLMKTEAHLTVFAADPAPELSAWADEGRLALVRRAMAPGDALCAVLFYAADEDPVEDARTVALA